MKGNVLLEWLDDRGEGRSLVGAYLAGFLHGQIACEARAESFKLPLSIPSSLDVPLLINEVRKIAAEKPELLSLDVGTFMYAVFEHAFSASGKKSRDA